MPFNDYRKGVGYKDKVLGSMRASSQFKNSRTEVKDQEIKDIAKKIDKIIVSNLDCMTRNHPDMAQSSNFANGYTFLKNEYDGNIELLRNSTNPNEYLYATAQPGYGSAETLKKALEEGPKKFVGIKLHPHQLNIPANDKVYEPYMQLAQSKKLPCLFHCELNVDWSVPQGRLFADKSKWSTSDPRYIIELAQKYPDVPVFLWDDQA